jgi:hypothetical protein
MSPDQKALEIEAAWRIHTGEDQPDLGGGIPQRFRARVRYALSEAQNHRCCYCGKRFGRSASSIATLEHILPQSLGGEWEIDNLAVACGRCNSTRGSEIWPVHLDALVAIGRLSHSESEKLRILIRDVRMRENPISSGME